MLRSGGRKNFMPSWPLLIDPISRLLDKLIPDPEARAKAQLELLKSEREFDLKELELVLSADKSQNEVNQEEAKNPNLFVSGWRPFIGWVCGSAFAYHFVLQPFLVFALAAQGITIELPEFPMETLLTVLLGMLGLGGMRTYEKVRQVTR
jgi:hypothetical protein